MRRTATPEVRSMTGDGWRRTLGGRDGRGEPDAAGAGVAGRWLGAWLFARMEGTTAIRCATRSDLIILIRPVGAVSKVTRRARAAGDAADAVRRRTR